MKIRGIFRMIEHILSIGFDLLVTIKKVKIVDTTSSLVF